MSVVEEVNRSDRIKSGENEPPLFQNQAANTHCPAMLIVLQLNCAAPLLKGSQRLYPLTSAKDSVKHDFAHEEK